MPTWFAGLALVALLVQAAPAAPGPDYDPGHEGWNGLSQFARLAGELGCPLAPRTVLDWDTLDGRDVLVILYPQARLAGRDLLAYLSAGGRVVLADR